MHESMIASGTYRPGSSAAVSAESSAGRIVALALVFTLPCCAHTGGCPELAAKIAPNAQRVASPGVTVVAIDLQEANAGEDRALRCLGFIEYEKAGETGPLRMINPVECVEEASGFIWCDNDAHVQWRPKEAQR